MDKEMSLNEKLEKLMDRFEEMDEKINFGSEFKTEYDVNWYTDIREALTEYEAIDNANPSEALECLEKLKGMEISSMPFSDEYGTQEVDLNDIRKVGSQLNTDFREYTATIKQALLKAQEQEKEKLFFNNIHNTKVKTPLVSIFEGLSKDERFKFTEHIYYHWEEMKEALEEQNKQLTEENIELKKKLNKHYLKWEDLEFKETHKIKILMNGNLYNLLCYDEKYIEIRTIKGEYMLTLDNDNSEDKQFFNDLRLERVEE